jgi:hypothetical protein
MPSHWLCAIIVEKESWKATFPFSLTCCKIDFLALLQVLTCLCMLHSLTVELEVAES